MVLVIFRGGAAAVCVPPMLLFRLSRSRASITLLLLLCCGVAPPLTLSPCTLGVNCRAFPLARLLMVCIFICGTRFWLCSCCVAAANCVDCVRPVNGLCPCLRELIIWRASCTPPAPPLPRILKRASFWPNLSLASFTWNTMRDRQETDLSFHSNGWNAKQTKWFIGGHYLLLLQAAA